MPMFILTRGSALAAFLWLLVAAPSSVSAQGGRDLAAGAGEVTTPTSTSRFGFAATSGPNGENAKGHVSIDDAHFTVECLAVGGNFAVIVATGPTGNIRLQVRDQGEPGAGVDRFELFPAQPADNCSFAIQPFGFSIDSGNIQVRDAP